MQNPPKFALWLGGPCSPKFSFVWAKQFSKGLFGRSGCAKGGCSNCHTGGSALVSWEFVFRGKWKSPGTCSHALQWCMVCRSGGVCTCSTRLAPWSKHSGPSLLWPPGEKLPDSGIQPIAAGVPRAARAPGVGDHCLALIPWGSYLFGCWLGGAATTAAGESGQVSALVGMPCNGAWCTAVVVVCVCVCVHLLDSPCTLEQAQRAFLAVPTRGKVARQLHPTNRGGAACCHVAWGWRRASGANPWGSYLLAWRRSNDCCRGSGQVSALVGMPCSVCCT